MNYLISAYTSSIIFTIIFNIALRSYGASIPIQLLIVLISAIVTISFLSKDAKLRGLKFGDSFWGLIGIIGVIIYHIFYAKKHPMSK